MISPRVPVNRKAGTAPGVSLLVGGLAAMPLISLTVHQPHLARYIGSAIYVTGVLWVLVVTSVADYKNGESYLPNFFTALVFFCIPLYFMLSALEVRVWLRILIALGELAVSFTLYQVTFRRYVLPVLRQKKSAQSQGDEASGNSQTTR